MSPLTIKRGEKHNHFTQDGEVGFAITIPKNQLMGWARV